MEHFIININFPSITAKGHILNKFDYETSNDLYNYHDEYGYPIIYNFLYKYVLQFHENKKLITFSPDPAISSATISGFSERQNFMFFDSDNGETLNYHSKLKIIYLTSTPHLNTEKGEITIKNITNSILSNLLCLNDVSFTGHKLKLESNNFFLIGLNEHLIEDEQFETLNKLNIMYFTLNQLRKKGIINIIQSINSIIDNNPILIIYDLSVTSFEIAPCVNRFTKDGLH